MEYHLKKGERHDGYDPNFDMNNNKNQNQSNW